MLRRQLYYLLKPYTPWGVRILARRVLARRQWSQHHARWPIDTAANACPANWPGWPHGKQFAFVLTHDVEGPTGLARAKHLAKLDIEAGFRSSFNFIPEGTYRVSSDLRQWLVERGFEIGVHDFRHDGRLFTSERTFKTQSRRINEYIREWGAAGFRGGFMLRNLDWLHDLEISYDASTFDTDPFEWQSDGARTIFPFVVPPRGHGQPKPGYVELPYTLAQDSTLFMVLKQPSIDIWCRKLDWIAAQGGMALLNVHPDYMHFQPTGADGPPVGSMYREFLRYVAEKYAGRFWQPLPHQMASFVWQWHRRPSHPRTPHDTSPA